MEALPEEQHYDERKVRTTRQAAGREIDGRGKVREREIGSSPSYRISSFKFVGRCVSDKTWQQSPGVDSRLHQELEGESRPFVVEKGLCGWDAESDVVVDLNHVTKLLQYQLSIRTISSLSSHKKLNTRIAFFIRLNYDRVYAYLRVYDRRISKLASPSHCHHCHQELINERNGTLDIQSYHVAVHST